MIIFFLVPLYLDSNQSSSRFAFKYFPTFIDPLQFLSIQSLRDYEISFHDVFVEWKKNSKRFRSIERAIHRKSFVDD